MSANQALSLSQLMNAGKLWRGAQQASCTLERVPTGDAQLNEILHGGFELGQLHEIQLPRWFCGELNLLEPVLKAAAEKKRPVFWVNPPVMPYAPGLSYRASEQDIHIVLDKLDEKEFVWAIEVILQAGSAALLMAWAQTFSAAATRRFQRAVQGKLTLAVMLSGVMPAEARSYQTRLRAELENGQVSWHVLKRPGGWPASTSARAIRRW